MGALASSPPKQSPSQKQQKQSGSRHRALLQRETSTYRGEFKHFSGSQAFQETQTHNMFRNSSGRSAAKKARMALMTRTHQHQPVKIATPASDKGQRRNDSSSSTGRKNTQQPQNGRTTRLRGHSEDPNSLKLNIDMKANHRSTTRRRSDGNMRMTSESSNESQESTFHMQDVLASRKTLHERRSRHKLPSQVDTPSWRVVSDNGQGMSTKASQFRRPRNDDYIRSSDMDSLLDSLSYDADSDDEEFLVSLSASANPQGKSNKRRRISSWPNINSSKHKSFSLDCFESIIEALEARSYRLEMKRRARTTEQQIYKELRKAARKTLWLLNVMAAHNTIGSGGAQSRSTDDIRNYDLNDIPGSPQPKGRSQGRRSSRKRQREQRNSKNHPFVGTPSWAELRNTCSKIARSMVTEAGAAASSEKDMIELVKELNSKTTAASERSKEQTASSRCSSDPASSSSSSSESGESSSSESDSDDTSEEISGAQTDGSYKERGETLAVWNMTESQGIRVIRRAFNSWLNEGKSSSSKKSTFPKRLERDLARVILQHWRKRREEMNGISLLRAYQGTSIEQHQSEDLNEDSRHAFYKATEPSSEYSYYGASSAAGDVASQEEIEEAHAINTAAELIYLKHLRNNLERARTLLDLAGRRERLKDSLDEKRVEELKQYLGCIASGISKADASRLYNLVFDEGSDDESDNPSPQSSTRNRKSQTETPQQRGVSKKKSPSHDGKVKYPSQFYRTWTYEEDEKLIQGYKRFGPSNWKSIRDWSGPILAKRTSAQMYKRYQRLRNHNQV